MVVAPREEEGIRIRASSRGDRLAYGPNRDPRNWRWVTPGSIVGALLWLAISALFALYTTFSHSYDKTYGSLAGAIILLLWLNYSALALLFGAELNAELERKGKPRVRRSPSRAITGVARSSAGISFRRCLQEETSIYSSSLCTIGRTRKSYAFCTTAASP